jgi:nucleoside-diphosphate-sugar epimerase
MRVAMTGGGRLGSHLLARKIGAGSVVTLLGPDLGPSRYTASIVAAGQARFIRCDQCFTDGAALQAAADADALVVLDSPPLPPASRPERLVDEIEAILTPLVSLLCGSPHARRLR